jgi:hypothetical protein
VCRIRQHADVCALCSKTIYRRANNTFEAASIVNRGPEGAKEVLSYLVAKDPFVCAVARTLIKLSLSSSGLIASCFLYSASVSYGALDNTNVFVLLADAGRCWSAPFICPATASRSRPRRSRREPR